MFAHMGGQAFPESCSEPKRNGSLVAVHSLLWAAAHSCELFKRTLDAIKRARVGGRSSAVVSRERERAERGEGDTAAMIGIPFSSSQRSSSWSAMREAERRWRKGDSASRAAYEEHKQVYLEQTDLLLANMRERQRLADSDYDNSESREIRKLVSAVRMTKEHDVNSYDGYEFHHPLVDGKVVEVSNKRSLRVNCKGTWRRAGYQDPLDLVQIWYTTDHGDVTLLRSWDWTLSSGGPRKRVRVHG